VPTLHHLALRTRDLERLLAFYRRWLELPIVRDQRPRSVWLGIEPSGLLMLEKAGPDDPPIPARSRELVAFAITAEERVRVRARLLEEGLLEGETEQTLYFRDPDGRRVGLSSYRW
jgi:catechol 2,3-dioxygenase-like lactoylglutathione lyase family enzyme